MKEGLKENILSNKLRNNSYYVQRLKNVNWITGIENTYHKNLIMLF
jgi:hypothetical protein